MRHRKNFNHLSRKTGHRKAMLANMASSLIVHKRIKTTTAKAKALKMYVEPLITKTKGLTSVTEKTHAQRVVFSYLKDKTAVHELFFEVAPKIEDRPGGYTRIIKLGNRLGDNSDMCFIELVDFNETMLSLKEESQKTGLRRRRRRGSGTVQKQAETSKKPVKEIETSAEETLQEQKEDLKVEATEETTVETIEKVEEKAVEEEIEEVAATEKEKVTEEIEEKKDDVQASAEEPKPETEEKNTEDQEKGEDSGKKEG